MPRPASITIVSLRLLSIIAFLAGSLMTSPLFAADAIPPARELVLGKQVLIIAHRGNSSEFPENTIPAFESAVKVGSDLVELDYYHSGDNQPVVIHDNILDRTTDAEKILGEGKLLVAKTPLADLLKLDAGTWFDEKFSGTKIPTLTESIDVIQSGSTTLIERKAGDADTVVKVIQEKELMDRVVVQAFDWDYVSRCRELAPTLMLAALGGKTASPAQLKAAAKTGAQVIAWNHQEISKAQIDQIHELGCKAWVYTVDDPKRALKLLEDGIDGIITNRPATMLKLRAAYEAAQAKATGPKATESTAAESAE